VLPFDKTKVKTVAVIGPNADPAVCSGSGSSSMNPVDAISVLAGVKSLLGPSVQVTTVPWRQYPPAKPQTAPLIPPVRPVAELIDDSVAAAKQADAVVLCVGFQPMRDGYGRALVKDVSADEGEGQDRSYALPPGQVDLIKAVTAANPRTVVILNAGGGIDWSGWLDSTPTLIDAWYPGQAGGQALAEIVFGDTNPSGKLPITLEKKWADVPSSPYYDHVDGLKAVYGEGVFAGYRGYDQNKIEPQFSFGFGLSYTTFAFSNLQVASTGDAQNPKVTVSFDVKNTDAMAGAEVGEVYVGDPHASVARPPRELKGFGRVQLAPGETKTISVDLDRDAFCFYDVASKSWKFEPGDFVVEAGASSRELPLEKTVRL
jgi:beta-glucosidase